MHSSSRTFRHKTHVVRSTIRTRRYFPKSSQQVCVRLHVTIPHSMQLLQGKLVNYGIDRDTVQERHLLLHPACIVYTAGFLGIKMFKRKVMQRDWPTCPFQHFVHQYQRFVQMFEHHNQIVAGQRVVHGIRIPHVP